MNYLDIFDDVGNVVSKLKMYPYFDVANYILMALMVRDDLPPPVGNVPFQRKHPFSTWLSMLLLSFAGGIITACILGEPPMKFLLNHRDILTMTIIWYLIFYAPFDIFYKLAKILPVKIIIYCLKEIQRTHKVYDGITHVSHHYPDAYLLMVVIGAIKGAGYYHMRIVERVVRGHWNVASSEFLTMSFTTKSCVIASVLFILHDLGFVAISHNILYLVVVIAFIGFRLSAILMSIADPMRPFENLFCALFLGGMWDALRNAISKPPVENEDEDKKKN